ncbi:tyrosine-type recombinase/integrase [Geodermatophilus amargosae]|uniref:tyrosine-type recombinase/integrase n=1 Tax=Geodermatophilus amargosae TaxID=1296565 RepID=UPI0034DE2DDA
MRRFCRWLVTEGEPEKAPTDGIEIPSPPDKPVPILTDDEIAALLKACAVSRGRPGTFDRTVFLGHRDEVVLRLLLDTGVRVSELCGLDLTDVDLDRELAYVTGKGSRPRGVPFGAKTAQAVDRYLRVRALHPYARSPRLLLGQRGPLTPDGARDVLHLRAARAGVADVHPHRFRHTFAHRWLAGGGQERDLMMLAGWRRDDCCPATPPPPPPNAPTPRTGVSASVSPVIGSPPASTPELGGLAAQPADRRGSDDRRC